MHKVKCAKASNLSNKFIIKEELSFAASEIQYPSGESGSEINEGLKELEVLSD